jgi:hypothetical protein
MHQTLIEPRLAAHLAKITKEQKYLDVATSAAQFLRVQLLAPNGLINENIDASTCQLDNSPQTAKSSGLAAQAWMMLANVTSSTEWRDLYVPFSDVPV